MRVYRVHTGRVGEATDTVCICASLEMAEELCLQVSHSPPAHSTQAMHSTGPRLRHVFAIEECVVADIGDHFAWVDGRLVLVHNSDSETSNESDV